MVLRLFYAKTITMIVSILALLLVLFFVIRFLVMAGKKKSEGKGLGDPGAGTGN
jgi:hypothetical protein